MREERFSLVAETLDSYPCSGFELQLNYSPYYFAPQEADAVSPPHLALLCWERDAWKPGHFIRRLTSRSSLSIVDHTRHYGLQN